MAKVLEEQRAILQKAAKPRIEGSGVCTADVGRGKQFVWPVVAA